MNPKGWRIVSLYHETYPTDPDHPYYVSICHYTGRRSEQGGNEYDEWLKGHLSEQQVMNAFRKYLKHGKTNALADFSRNDPSAYKKDSATNARGCVGNKTGNSANKHAKTGVQR